VLEAVPVGLLVVLLIEQGRAGFGAEGVPREAHQNAVCGLAPDTPAGRLQARNRQEIDLGRDVGLGPAR